MPMMAAVDLPAQKTLVVEARGPVVGEAELRAPSRVVVLVLYVLLWIHQTIGPVNTVPTLMPKMPPRARCATMRGRQVSSVFSPQQDQYYKWDMCLSNLRAICGT